MSKIADEWLTKNEEEHGLWAVFAGFRDSIRNYDETLELLFDDMDFNGKPSYLTMSVTS